MTDIITEKDIFLLRSGFMEQDGNAQAMLVFENGRGLLISQDDIRPSTIPLEDTKFVLTAMRVTTLPFNKTAELCNSSDHPIEAMKGQYERRGFTLAQAAEIATQLSAAKPVGEFTTEEIVDFALEHGPCRPSQIGITPISSNNGMELDAEALREDMQQGKLRKVGDYDAPMKFNLFLKDNDILLITADEVLDPMPFFATHILLPTGHAVKITSTGTQKNSRFSLTTLMPNQNLKLAPTYVKGIDQCTLDASREYAVQEAIENGIEIDDMEFTPYGEDNPTITNLSLWNVRNAMNDLIKRRSIMPESGVNLIIEANKRGEIILGQHTNYCSDLYPITQFDGKKYDPYTGRPVDLFSSAQIGATVGPMSQGWHQE